MKIKKIAITILMTTFLIIIGNKVEATTGKINSETVRIRKEPNTKSTIIDQLDKGDEVEILEQEEDWYKIKVKTEQGTITGYISEKLVDVEGTSNATNDEKQDNQQNNENITPDIPEENTETSNDNEITTTVETTIESIQKNEVYILEQEIALKAVPLMNSIEIGKANGSIEIIEIINDWSRIETETEIGWVRNNILKQILIKNETTTTENPVETKPDESKITEPEPDTTDKNNTTNTTTDSEEKDINKTGYVSAEGLRVREEPSTDSKELDSLSKNDEVKIIGQTGNWYKIKINGKTGYVSAKYISDTKLPETTSRSGNTLKNTELTPEEKKDAQVEENKEQTEVAEKVTGSKIVEYAKKYLGYKYVSGGTTPTTGFDCSGFTLYVYKNFGVSLNRTSSGQMSNGEAVEKSELQLGDIVLFNNDANTTIGHVGIYIGDGNFIHASNPSDGVKITTLTTGYYKKRYVGARRVI